MLYRTIFENFIYCIMEFSCYCIFNSNIVVFHPIYLSREISRPQALDVPVNRLAGFPPSLNLFMIERGRCLEISLVNPNFHIVHNFCSYFKYQRYSEIHTVITALRVLTTNVTIRAWLCYAAFYGLKRGSLGFTYRLPILCLRWVLLTTEIHNFI